MSPPAPYQPPAQPHRAVPLVVAGAVGLAVCAPLGIAVLLMAQNDLRLMDWGRMDESGRRLTGVARTLGWISLVALAIQIVVAWKIWARPPQP